MKIRRKEKKRKRGTRKSHRKGKPRGKAADRLSTREKRGFTPPKRREYTIMNIGRINLLLNEGRLTPPKEEGKWVIHPKELDVDKVLGAGRVDEKIKLVVPPNTKVSTKAEEKIKDAGGSISRIEG